MRNRSQKPEARSRKKQRVFFWLLATGFWLPIVIAAGLMARGEAPGPLLAVHEITLPRYQPNLPPGPGRAAFATACLACHTDRYIVTQPAFPQATWDAEVKKMISTYGCYVTAEQEPLIVQYVIALQKSPEGKMISPVPPWAPGPDIRAMQKSDANYGAALAAGQALFAKDCAICHVAAVHHPAANLALPLPTDLSTIVFSSRTLAADIHNGVPGTAMPAFSYLKDSDLQALMTYCQSLAPMPEHVAAAPVEARQLFMTDCLACHGPAGEGNGFAAPELARPAANFTAEQPTADLAYHVISDGIAGTSMPQWKTKLSDAQRHELADYVRSLYR